MQSCATAGSIVVVYITNFRSDAIIVTANAFKVLPLPGLSAGQAKDWISQDLTTTSPNDRGPKKQSLLPVLVVAVARVCKACAGQASLLRAAFRRRPTEDLVDGNWSCQHFPLSFCWRYLCWAVRKYMLSGDFILHTNNQSLAILPRAR
jgi:hypothetical protein